MSLKWPKIFRRNKYSITSKRDDWTEILDLSAWNRFLHFGYKMKANNYTHEVIFILFEIFIWSIVFVILTRQPLFYLSSFHVAQQGSKWKPLHIFGQVQSSNSFPIGWCIHVIIWNFTICIDLINIKHRPHLRFTNW